MQTEQTPEQKSAERTILGWPTEDDNKGVTHYYDATAGLWRTLEDAVDQLVRRRRAQGVLGTVRDTAALNDYERSRGL